MPAVGLLPLAPVGWIPEQVQVQALAQQQTGGPFLGLLFAVLAAVLFAVGAVLQHEAAELSSSNGSLSLRRLIKRRRWMLGQTAFACSGASTPGSVRCALGLTSRSPTSSG